MRKIPCYLYKEYLDFVYPEEYSALYGHARPYVSDLLLRDTDGNLYPHPEFFTQVSPEQAEVYIFPHDIGIINDYFGGEKTTALLKQLPYMQYREKYNIISDGGDFSRCVNMQVCLLKRSIIAEKTDYLPSIPFVIQHNTHDQPYCIVTWYNIPEHVCGDKPDINFASLRYDVSFVGRYSHYIREVACKSAEREEKLSFYNGGFDKIIIKGNYFFNKELSYEDKLKHERQFRNITKASLTVLCPPGVGPQSARMYECLYYGRIPVLFLHDIRYPLEHIINYEDFCLFIDKEDIIRTGEIVRDFIMKHSREELHQKCILARKTHVQYFRNEDRVKHIARLTVQYLDALRQG
ncbi:MAG: glycosyltransferase family 47 protein [Desulfovibrio sp.]|jgi:hypothetical protein|nr:glycosyltransferase family 47 protein [Desulfovibrio sp.]